MERIAILLVFLLVLVAGCGRPADATPGAGGVELPAEGVSGLPLGRVLGDLEAKLDSALAEGLGTGSARWLAEAEAVTDRLIETELPFAWLEEGGYSVEARLRQIQALADRVIAEVRGGTDRGVLGADVHELRERVRDLHRDLERGGGAVPTPVGDLLRVMDTIRS